MQSPIRAVLWDIDGTLVDSEPWHYQSLIAVCRSIGLDVSAEGNRGFVGVSFRDMFGSLSRFGKVTLTFEEFHQAVLADYVAHVDRVTKRDGAPELVDRFARLGLRQACVSNSPACVIEPNLEIFDDPRLEFAIGREDVANGKPDPEGYLLAAKRLGLDPVSCAVIEDSPVGAQAAKAAGMLTIAWPQDPNFVFDAADHIVDDPGELDWDALCGVAAERVAV
jgi:beta-phosphoglucomutase-like phosphatase (HAD superfamily)